MGKKTRMAVEHTIFAWLIVFGFALADANEITFLCNRMRFVLTQAQSCSVEVNGDAELELRLSSIATQRFASELKGVKNQWLPSKLSSTLNFPPPSNKPGIAQFFRDMATVIGTDTIAGKTFRVFELKDGGFTIVCGDPSGVNCRVLSPYLRSVLVLEICDLEIGYDVEVAQSMFNLFASTSDRPKAWGARGAVVQLTDGSYCIHRLNQSTTVTSTGKVLSSFGSSIESSKIANADGIFLSVCCREYWRNWNRIAPVERRFSIDPSEPLSIDPALWAIPKVPSNSQPAGNGAAP